MWVAAILSAVVDNIPFTVTMIPIVAGLQSQGLAVEPLWWALAIGVGLGGNGTHIGATANIICVAEAERSGLPAARIDPVRWLKIGLPAMLGSLVIASLIFAALYQVLYAHDPVSILFSVFGAPGHLHPKSAVQPQSKYPPAKPGALDCEPLKAANRGR
jgi:hypothetical protein